MDTKDSYKYVSDCLDKLIDQLQSLGDYICVGQPNLVCIYKYIGRMDDLLSEIYTEVSHDDWQFLLTEEHLKRVQSMYVFDRAVLSIELREKIDEELKVINGSQT